MLRELHIRNYALIDELHLELSAGFSVLTGETGAGKSILIGALGVILGDRVGSDVIRSGAGSAVIEAVFDVDGDRHVDKLLDELGADDDGALILSREVTQSGPNKCWINGRRTTVSMLKDAGRWLVDIHGQHEHQSLLRADSHIDMLDAFGGSELLAARKRYEESFRRWKKLAGEAEVLRTGERERAHQLDLCRFQLEEIENAALVPGEDENLDAERVVLANSERLKEATDDAYETLYGGDLDSQAVLDRLGKITDALRSILRLDARLSGPAELLESAQAQIQEAAHELRRYRDEVEADPERLSQLERRDEEIRRLKRKYGDSVDAVLAFAEQTKEEIHRLEDSDSQLETVQRQVAQLDDGLRAEAACLTEARESAAKALAAAVEEELLLLNMGNTRFEVRVETEADHVQPTGCDRVEFFIQPNPGEALKPLARIASGGEISRIMLALKSILADADRVPTLIFDEVDTGVGGTTAVAVAQRLVKLSGAHQVVSVTHLPQVASHADYQFVIAKQVVGNRTETRVERLSRDDRVRELARMLGGESATARVHAAEMLKLAEETKIAM